MVARKGYHGTVVQVKTNSLSWDDCRDREVKTLNVYKSFEEVFYRREKKNV